MCSTSVESGGIKSVEDIHEAIRHPVRKHARSKDEFTGKKVRGKRSGHKVKVYVRSWEQWSADADAPVEK